ncbi:MAG: ornithine cyclodeaminase family protein, partial [Actinobacteria bacterium]|nr:ornithine cyclodeaminase family protein [Actinomycetota bacterium]
QAHAELSTGKASLPPRVAAFTDKGLLGAMPGYLPGASLGAKLVSLFPANRPPVPTHQAAIVLFDGDTGVVTALMDGTYITAMRTAAAAALSARLLARPDSRVLAVLGTGVQSRAAQEMFPRALPFAEVRVAGRGEQEDAVRGADVVHTATHAAEPILFRAHVAPGTHVSSVGYNAPGSELDPALVAATTPFVESRDSAFAPVPAGAPELAGMDPASVAEIGEVIAGIRPGRTSADEITLYKSVGVAVQDLAAAALVLAAARAHGSGLEVELEEVPV